MRYAKHMVLIAVYAAAFAANVGYFAWSYDVGWLQILTSIIYAATWIWFMCSSGSGRVRRHVAVFAGGLTLAGGIFGLLARAFGYGLFTFLGLATAGLSITPLYGLLGLIGDYDLFYGAAVVLGAGVCGLAMSLWRERV